MENLKLENVSNDFSGLYSVDDVYKVLTTLSTFDRVRSYRVTISCLGFYNGDGKNSHHDDKSLRKKVINMCWILSATLEQPNE